MRIYHCIVLLICILNAAGLRARGADQSPDTSYGYGDALTADDRNVILIEILPRQKGDEEHVVNARVLADVHGKIKDGSNVRIASGAVQLMGSAEYNVPDGAPGLIEVWPVKESGPGKSDYDDIQGDLPFGIDSHTRIANSDIDKVKAAMNELRSALEAPQHAAPSRARVNELLKEKNFYLWAIGTWCLARTANAADEKQLKDLDGAPDCSLAQAMWLHRVLELQVIHGDTEGVLSRDEINTHLISFLNAYVKRQPGPADSIAPASAPPIGKAGLTPATGKALEEKSNGTDTHPENHKVKGETGTQIELKSHQPAALPSHAPGDKCPECPTPIPSPSSRPNSAPTPSP